MPLFLRRGAEPVDGGAQPLDGLVPAHHAGQVHAAAGGALLARQGDAQGVQQPAVLVLHPLGQSLAGVEQAVPVAVVGALVREQQLQGGEGRVVFCFLLAYRLRS